MIEEDEEEDLLTTPTSDNDDELSENEENEVLDRASERVLTQLHTNCLEKITFVCCVAVLVVASTCVLVLLPVFTTTLAAKGDAYTALLFLSATSTATFFGTALVLGSVFGFREMLGLPYALPRMARCSLVFGVGGVLVVYALDRNRVLCHLQDPIKGVVLVAALVFYFCFCRKVMGLRKIFASTTVVAGLFISVDYGLCDEFRCRGFERLRKEDDTGGWSWQTHAVWTAVYVLGLVLWALHFTLLEDMVAGGRGGHRLADGTGLLATVSRLVFTRDASRTALLEDETTPSTSRQERVLVPGLRAVSLAAWTHLVALILVVSLSWTDMIGLVGGGTSSSEAFWNVTASGLSCLLTAASPDCSTAKVSGWLLVVAYAAFAISSLQLLIVSQSSVLVVATATVGLPLAGLWWSAFSLDPAGVVAGSFPGVTGELVCSLLGLPVVVAALAVMCKAFVVAPASVHRRRGDPDVMHA